MPFAQTAHVGRLLRNLKLANIMLDARGKVRIIDFALALLTGTFKEKGEIPSATPVYIMAPEQLAGRAVTDRSNIHALGLVLYEMFCGRQAFRAESIAEYWRAHEQARPPSPSEIFEYIDPGTERAILRCLEKNPDDRPESALAVAASLPGGDTLAASLALGQTPSPQMVAATTSESGPSPWHGLAFLGAFLAVMYSLLVASRRTDQQATGADAFIDPVSVDGCHDQRHSRVSAGMHVLPHTGIQRVSGCRSDRAVGKHL